MKKLSKKQKGFADDYLETGNGTQSVMKNYDVNNEKTASVIATENLGKPSIQQYLEENASGAISRIVELSKNAENESVRLNANKDIADRAGYKPVEKSINLNVETEITNPKAVELAKKYEEELKKSL